MGTHESHAYTQRGKINKTINVQERYIIWNVFQIYLIHHHLQKLVIQEMHFLFFILNYTPYLDNRVHSIFEHTPQKKIL